MIYLYANDSGIPHKEKIVFVSLRILVIHLVLFVSQIICHLYADNPTLYTDRLQIILVLLCFCKLNVKLVPRDRCNSTNTYLETCIYQYIRKYLYSKHSKYRLNSKKEEMGIGCTK